MILLEPLCLWHLSCIQGLYGSRVASLHCKGLVRQKLKGGNVPDVTCWSTAGDHEFGWLQRSQEQMSHVTSHDDSSDAAATMCFTCASKLRFISLHRDRSRNDWGKGKAIVASSGPANTWELPENFCQGPLHDHHGERTGLSTCLGHQDGKALESQWVSVGLSGSQKLENGPSNFGPKTTSGDSLSVWPGNFVWGDKGTPRTTQWLWCPHQPPSCSEPQRGFAGLATAVLIFFFWWEIAAISIEIGWNRFVGATKHLERLWRTTTTSGFSVPHMASSTERRWVSVIASGSRSKESGTKMSSEWCSDSTTSNAKGSLTQQVGIQIISYYLHQSPNLQHVSFRYSQGLPSLAFPRQGSRKKEKRDAAEIPHSAGVSTEMAEAVLWTCLNWLIVYIIHIYTLLALWRWPPIILLLSISLKHRFWVRMGISLPGWSGICDTFTWCLKYPYRRRLRLCGLLGNLGVNP